MNTPVKVWRVVLALFCLCLTTKRSSAGVPALAPGIGVSDALGRSVLLGYVSPDVVDWDGDGRRDLLVGDCGAGCVRLFPNLGSDDHPVLNNGFTRISADGVRLELPFR